MHSEKENIYRPQSSWFTGLNLETSIPIQSILSFTTSKSIVLGNSGALEYIQAFTTRRKNEIKIQK